MHVTYSTLCTTAVDLWHDMMVNQQENGPNRIHPVLMADELTNRVCHCVVDCDSCECVSVCVRLQELDLFSAKESIFHVGDDTDGSCHDQCC